MILLDICELIVDCPHSTAKDEGHGFPLIRTPNIGKGRLILDNVHRVCKEVYDKRNIRAIPQVNDIILAREAPAGNVALITKGQKVCLGQRTVLIRPNINKVNPEYLVYYMLSPKVQHDLQSSANGATVAHINMPKIRNLKIQIPNRVIQDKIATILSHYDSLIENYQKQIKLLEESAQRLYKEWFVDLRYPGHENTKVVDGVPEGWSFSCLNSIATDSGIKENKGNLTQYNYYLPLDCLPSKSIAYFESKSINLAESSLIGFHKNDILFGALRPYFHKVVIARHSGITRSTCFVLNAKKPEYWTYLVMLLYSKQTIDYATQNAIGTTMPYIRLRDFMQMKILIPDFTILYMFTNKIEHTLHLIKVNAELIINLTEARDRLLPKLMNGEIEV